LKSRFAEDGADPAYGRGPVDPVPFRAAPDEIEVLIGGVRGQEVGNLAEVRFRVPRAEADSVRFATDFPSRTHDGEADLAGTLDTNLGSVAVLGDVLRRPSAGYLSSCPAAPSCSQGPVPLRRCRGWRKSRALTSAFLCRVDPRRCYSQSGAGRGPARLQPVKDDRVHRLRRVPIDQSAFDISIWVMGA
jgi:hypothetical protein